MMTANLLLPVFALTALALPAQESKPSDTRSTAERMLQTADEIIDEVAALRGIPFKREVEKGVHSAEELREFLNKKIFEEELGPEKLARYQWMLSSMGFIPADTNFAETLVDVLLSQIGGFYDPERNSFFMMEDAAEYGDFANRTMIAHELTHALDDQYYDLDGLMEGREDHDAAFAIAAVVEGSATALMTRWQAGHAAEMDMAEMQAAMKQTQEQAVTMQEAPAYFSTIVANYLVGMAFMLGGETKRNMIEIQGALMQLENGVAANLAKVVADPPVSSEQVLHSEKYWIPAERDLPAQFAEENRLIDALAAALDLPHTGSDTLGELHCALLGRDPKRSLNMALMSVPSYWTNKAARGWGGDRVLHFGSAEEGALLWITLWDTEGDRQEFVDAYDKFYGEDLNYAVASSGRVALFDYGGDAKRAEKLLEIVRDAPVVKGEQRFPLDDNE